MKIIDRIFQLIEFQGISVSKFEKNNGISAGYLSKMRAQDSFVGEKMIVSILDNNQNLSPSWLVLGKGEMFIDNNAGTTITINNTKHSGTGDAISGNNIMANNKGADEKYYRDIIAEKESIIAEKDKRITELTDTLIKMALK